MAHPWIIQSAAGVPFDNSTNGFTSDNVQDAIQEVRNLALGNDVDAFQFGLPGNVNSNAWMNTIFNVPSDNSPDIMAFDMVFRRFSWSNAANASPFTIELWRSVPGNPANRTLLYSEVFSGRTGYTAADLSYAVPVGHGVGVKITDVGQSKPQYLNIKIWMRQGTV